MNLAVALSTFGLVLVAELPDKTMIATLVMGSRYRPVLVWLGAAVAFTLHAAMAVIAGRLLQLLPHRWVEGITAVLFAAGALYLLLVPERAEEEAGEHEAARAVGTGGSRTVATAFTIIFVGEFGDLTQILTANLAARYHDPVSVFLGALAALLVASAAAAFGGRLLLRVAPLGVIRRLGGLLLAGLAIYALVTLVTG